MPKTLCEICDNDKFENINGFYYCTVCNTQSKNVRDIELHEDEDVKHVGQKELTRGSKPKKLIKEEDTKEEVNIDASFSTYHVFNHLLCAQADDLVRLGVNPIIKRVILKLWMKYLQKVGIAFLPSKSNKLNESNIKWERDKKYFSLQKLIEESEDVKPVKVEPKLEPKLEPIDDFEQDELNSKSNSNDESSSEDEYDEVNMNESLNQHDEAPSKSQILLNRFEWFRMPHTIVILNLSLLLIRSNLLITDLIRLIKNGKISYFNIDSVLPESMNFSYGEDATMFNTHTTPTADCLRYLTSRFGQFLELQTFKIVSIKEITSRFIIDLNLPNQLHVLVNSLLDKIRPIDRFDFSKAEYENLEAIALAYIYVVIVIIYQYDANLSRLDPSDLEDKRYFHLNEWIKNMQNRLHCFKLKLKTDMKDLSCFNQTAIKHRFNMKTYPYITQYRQCEIKRALRAPLEDSHVNETKEEEVDKFETLNTLHSLAYINDKSKNPTEFSSRSLSLLLTEEKLKLITDKQFRSASFKMFSRDCVQTLEFKAKYLIGLEANTFDWLLEMFQCLAQCSTFVKMFRYVDNLLNKLNSRKV